MNAPVPNGGFEDPISKSLAASVPIGTPSCLRPGLRRLATPLPRTTHYAGAMRARRVWPSNKLPDAASEHRDPQPTRSVGRKPSGCSRLRWLFNQRWFSNFRPCIPAAYIQRLLGRFRSAISDFVLLLFRGDCPSVATPQSKVGFIIPAALLL